MNLTENIEFMFSQLVDDPKSLMKAMEKGGDVLSGSRAANSFVDGLCDENSDWDFYCRCCDPDETAEKCELYKYFRSIGCNWEEVQLRYNDQVLNVHTGTFRGVKIQLVVHRLENMIDGILGFHSTVPQCIVAHDSTFCAYYDLLKEKKGIEWTTKLTKNVDLESGIPNNEGATMKYIRRGIKFIKYNEYVSMLEGNVPEPRLRKAGDDSSCLLMDGDYCSLSNISWLECPEGCVMLSA